MRDVERRLRGDARVLKLRAIEWENGEMDRRAIKLFKQADALAAARHEIEALGSQRSQLKAEVRKMRKVQATITRALHVAENDRRRLQHVVDLTSATLNALKKV